MAKQDMQPNVSYDISALGARRTFVVLGANTTRVSFWTFRQPGNVPGFTAPGSVPGEAGAAITMAGGLITDDDIRFGGDVASTVLDNVIEAGAIAAWSGSGQSRNGCATPQFRPGDAIVLWGQQQVTTTNACTYVGVTYTGPAPTAVWVEG
jgi:hypothetical protein